MIPGYGAIEALDSALKGLTHFFFFVLRVCKGKLENLQNRRSNLQQKLNTQEEEKSRLARDINASERRNAFHIFEI